MITIFTIPKPFLGHIGLIQENAIRSWRRCVPGSEIVLFGDETGTAQIAEQYGCKHVPFIRCNDAGTPYLSEVFKEIHQIAIFPDICYVNGDILFLTDFSRLMVEKPNSRYLIVGRRTNIDVKDSINFEDTQTVDMLKEYVGMKGERDKPWAIDYFIFPKGQIQDMPPFVVGRAGWDNWMIWYHVSKLRIMVLDASDFVCAIHQRHDYQHIQNGAGDLWEGKESEVNRRLMGGWERRYYSILDATHRYNSQGQIERMPKGSLPFPMVLKRGITSIIPYFILNACRTGYLKIKR